MTTVSDDKINGNEGKPFSVISFKNSKQIQLTRPKYLNSLEKDTFPQIEKLIDTWDTDKNIKVVFSTGAGGKAFCSGGDIREISSFVDGKHTSLARDFVYNEYRMDRALFRFSKPYVPIMHGYVMGGGCGFSCPGGYRICTETTNWAMPEVTIGFYPDVGVTYYLSRLKNDKGGGIGMFLALTGYSLTPDDCIHFGTATHYIYSKDIDNMMHDVDNEPEKIEEILGNYDEKRKKLLVSSGSTKLQEYSRFIAKVFDRGHHKCVEDIVIALHDYLEDPGGEPSNKGFAKEILDIMSICSPFSLKITYKCMELANEMTSYQVLEMNYILSTKLFTYSTDFPTGVQAKLITKQRAKWQFKTLQDVPDDFVNFMFIPWSVIHPFVASISRL